MANQLLIEHLREEIERGRLMAIVGEGVSIRATNGNPLASLKGLLENGIERCSELSRELPSQWKERLLSEIHSGDLDDLLSGAEKVSRKLGAPNGGEYRRWLRETVGSLHSSSRNDVIEALQTLGVKLATTNYDGLIEEVTGLPPVTWMQGASVERVIRGDDDGVLHLNGYWNQPESVVLGNRAYEEIMGDAHATMLLRALQTMTTLLFVGFVFDQSDTKLDELLRWTGLVFTNSESRRFLLARESEVKTLQAKHPAEQRVYVLSFGNQYIDLAPFLRALRPPAHRAHQMRPRLLKSVLSGHEGPVLGLAVTADSRAIVSGSQDGTVRIWNILTGSEIHRFLAGGAKLTSVAITGNGTRVLCGDGSGSLTLWDVESSQKLRTLQFEHSRNTSVMIGMSWDGRLAISATKFNDVTLWDLEIGVPVALTAAESPVSAVALSLDGQRAVYICIDGKFHVLETKTPRVVKTMMSGSTPITGLALTPDGYRAITGHRDGMIMVWDLNECRLLKTLPGHSSSVFGIAMAAGGRRIVSGSRDGVVKIWDLDRGNELETLESKAQLCSMAVTRDGRLAISGSEDGSLQIWDVSKFMAISQQLPRGLDRLRLAYLAVLERPDLFELLETLDEAHLQEVLEQLVAVEPRLSGNALERLTQRHPEMVLNPLWSAWIETVYPEKLAGIDVRATGP